MKDKAQGSEASGMKAQSSKPEQAKRPRMQKSRKKHETIFDVLKVTFSVIGDFHQISFHNKTQGSEAERKEERRGVKLDISVTSLSREQKRKRI